MNPRHSCFAIGAIVAATAMCLGSLQLVAQSTQHASGATPSASPSLPPPGEGDGDGPYGLGLPTCPGDECDSPIVVDPNSLSNSPTLPFDNTCATPSPSDPHDCVATQEKTVWFALTPPFTGRMQVSTCGGLSFNCYVSVYIGDCDSPQLVCCSDDFCGQQSEIEWPVAAGVTYRLMVSGKSSQSGTGTIRLGSNIDAVANDEPLYIQGSISSPTIPGPMMIPPNGPFPFAVTEANIDLASPPVPNDPCCPNDPVQACTTGGPSPNSRSVWFTWAPRSNAAVSVNTCGSSYDTVVSVFAGSTSILVACNDDALGGPCVGPASFASWSATAGTTYLIEVTQHGVGGGSPRLTLTLDRANSPPITPPRPTGSRYAFAGRPITLAAQTTDPDGDPIVYTFDWGDGALTSSSVVASGTPVMATHVYAADGFYGVRVKATDSHVAESVFSDPKIVQVLDLVCRSGNVNSDVAGAPGESVLAATDADGLINFGRGPSHVVNVHRTQSFDLYIKPAPAGPTGVTAKYIVFGWRTVPTPNTDTELDLGVGRMCMNPYLRRCGGICATFAASNLHYSCRKVLCPGPEATLADLRGPGELVLVMQIPANTFSAGEVLLVHGAVSDLSDTSGVQFSVTNALGVVFVD